MNTQKAEKRGSLPFSWVAADALYGDSPAFRDGINVLGKWYFTELKNTILIWRTQPKVQILKWKGAVVNRPDCVCATRATVHFR